MGGLLDRFSGGRRRPRRFAAVDCDGRQVRVVHAERSGRGARVLRSSSVSIPPELDVSDPQQLGRLVGQALRDMRLRGVGLLMNVTRGEAVLKPVTLPPGTSDQEIAGMVSFQVGKELPFRPEEAVIDFTIESHYDAEAAPGGDAEKGIDVLVGAVRLPVVDCYRRIAEAAGAKLLRLGLKPYANVRCVNACRQTGFDDNVLLLNLGAEETEIDLLVSGSLVFSRSATVKIPPADASADERAESVRAVAMEVRRSVQSYLAVETPVKIDSIVIAGGTGVESEVGRELATAMSAPCHMLDVSPAADLAGRADASAFISALGLAIGHGESERLPFDFLHPKRPARPTRRRRRTAFTAAAVAVLALLACVAGAAIHVGSKRAEARAVEVQLEQEKKTRKSLLGIEKQVRELSQWRDDRRNWLSHWAALSATFPGAEDAYITGLKSAEAGGEWSLSFVVKARDSKIITDFCDRLADVGYKFKPGGVTTTPDPYGYPYSAEVRVFVEPNTPLDLATTQPAARPADDDSIRQLARRGSPRPAPASPSAAAPASRGDSGSSRSGRNSSGDSGDDRRLTEAVKQEFLKEILSRYDRNRDGKLSSDERRWAYSYIRRSKYVRYFDENRNGQLDRDEYSIMRDILGGQRK